MGARGGSPPGTVSLRHRVIQAVRLEITGSQLMHFFTPLKGFLAEETRTKIDLDDTTIFCQCPDHLVTHIALPAGREVPRGRVGGNHRDLADFKNLVKSFIGHM